MAAPQADPHNEWFRDLPRRPRDAYKPQPQGPEVTLGPGLSEAIRNAALSASTIYSICLGRATGVDEMPDDWDAASTAEGVNMRVGLSVGWCGTHQQTDQAKVVASVGYFCFMPNVAENEIPTGVRAAEKLRQCAGAILINKARCQANLLTGFAAAWEVFRHEENHANVVLFSRDGEVPEVKFGDDGARLPMMDITLSRLTLNACGLIFALAGRCYIGATRVLSQSIIHYIVAISKHGEITREKGRKIFRELSRAMDKEYDFDEEIFTQCWRVAGPRVNAQNASATIQALTGFIGNGPEVLRLRLTLQQSEQSGLTSIVLIRRALIGHPKFAWAKLAQLFPTEATAVTAAFEQIGNNPYYGYSANLNNARATKYQNITWVCKTLLIDLDGDTTLRNYRGFKGSPAHQDIVRQMISLYTARYNEGFMNNPSDGDVDADVNMFEEALRSNGLASEQSQENVG